MTVDEKYLVNNYSSLLSNRKFDLETAGLPRI